MRGITLLELLHFHTTDSRRLIRPYVFGQFGLIFFWGDRKGLPVRVQDMALDLRFTLSMRKAFRERCVVLYSLNARCDKAGSVVANHQKKKRAPYCMICSPMGDVKTHKDVDTCTQRTKRPNIHRTQQQRDGEVGEG